MALPCEAEPFCTSSLGEMLSSLSRLLNPRRTGPDFKNEPVPIVGTRFTRVEPGGGAASVTGLRVRPTVDEPNFEVVSGAW